MYFVKQWLGIHHNATYLWQLPCHTDESSIKRNSNYNL